MPETYHELTSRRVLTTAWIEGEKLSQSTADDVGDLVNVGVISYLKQLLDTGFFHVRLLLCPSTLGSTHMTVNVGVTSSSDQLLDTGFFHMTL